MPSTIASVTDLIIDDFNSATEFGEFTIQKLTDATTPKLSDDAARMSSGSLMPSDGIDFILDLGGSDASSPDGFPTETMKMTYGAIEWTYAPGDFSPDGSEGGRDALPLEQVSDPPSQHELEHVSFTYQKIVGEYPGDDGGIVIDWTTGHGAGRDAFPTETIFPTESIHPLEGAHSDFDLLF
jgi:type VI protein secretion system component Hcp